MSTRENKIFTTPPPEEYCCPITFELMEDPVSAADGRTYERDAITQWVEKHGTSPFTRQPLNAEFKPNITLLAEIRAWQKEEVQRKKQEKKQKENQGRRQRQKIKKQEQAETQARLRSVAEIAALDLATNVSSNTALSENQTPEEVDKLYLQLCGCETIEAGLALLEKYPILREQKGALYLNSSITLEGREHTSVFLWITGHQNYLSIVNKYPSLIEGIAPETLNTIQINIMMKIGDYSYKEGTIFFSLCHTEFGLSFLLKNPALIGKISSEALNNRVTRIITESTPPILIKNYSALFCLCAYPRGRALLLENPELVAKITRTGLNREILEGEFKGSSPVQSLIYTPDGKQLLKKNPELIEKINFDTLAKKTLPSDASPIAVTLFIDMLRKSFSVGTETEPESFLLEFETSSEEELENIFRKFETIASATSSASENKSFTPHYQKSSSASIGQHRPIFSVSGNPKKSTVSRT